LINIYKYIKTAQIAMRGQTNGGIIYLFPNILVNLMYLLPLMFLWRVIAGSGIDAGMSLSQLLTYTYINALLGEMLIVRTMASSWNYEGQLINLYARPAPVFGQIIAHTVGTWIPMLIIFSLPMLIIAPLFNITIIPATLWFFPSLILCISLGFAIDFIFACVTIRLRGMAWLGYSIRMAIASLFSGTVIPFRILPFGLTRIFEYQPFGSLGGAPLSLFVGTTDPARIIITQIVWNIILWTAAVLWFRQSKERQVSYGG
jgi:ABC-2 type transport system permease protein